jgi:hypothetical protein
VDEVKPAACVPTVEHREPCESRGSRTVLGAPGGEIPPGDSTKAVRLRSSTSFPVCPQQRTFVSAIGTSVQCQKETHAPQQNPALFDHLVGAQQERFRDGQSERFRGG